MSRTIICALSGDRTFRQSLVRRFGLAIVAASMALAGPALAGKATSIFHEASIAPSLDHRAISAPTTARIKVVPATAGQFSHRYNHFAPSEAANFAARMDPDFGQVAGPTTLSSRQLAEAFAKAKTAQASLSAGFSIKRESVAAVVTEPEAPVVMAYADPSPVDENGSLAAIDAIAPTGEGEGLDMLKTGALPASVRVPLARPSVVQDDVLQPGKRSGSTARSETPRARAVALARPENPGESKGVGKSFRNLFGRPRAGNGVAVYDISAARVYMPDGSVLEAHSGIGKMADNPRYAHVKMSGPTPPHTYNLRMRERRFHGVEAIRMLPVDGRNKHGRDGFLTHSYLLRGGRPESHGCVAFKDYNRFLNAFKKGHVKQLIVVPSGGSAIARRASRSGDV